MNFIKNKLPIYSIGNPGNLTYDYKILGENTQDLKEIIEGKNPFNLLLFALGIVNSDIY